MGYTTIALGVALAVVIIWLGRAWTRRARNPEARCRRDIAALRRTDQTRDVDSGSEHVWSAGAGTDADPAQSRAKKTTAWVATGAAGGGCGGCGGCGCGG
jgi:uncharacterized membrane protein YccC